MGAMVRKSFNRVAGTIGGALTGSVFLYVVDAVGGQWKQNLAGAILSGGIMMFGRFHMAKSPKTGYAWLIFMLTFLIVVNDGWKVVAGDNVISHSFETALWRTVHVALGCVIIVVTSCVVFPNYARKTLRLQTGVIVGQSLERVSRADDESHQRRRRHSRGEARRVRRYRQEHLRRANARVPRERRGVFARELEAPVLSNDRLDESAERIDEDLIRRHRFTGKHDG